MSQTKYVVKFTTQFRKDYKLAMNRHLDIDLLDDIIRKLASSEDRCAFGCGRSIAREKQGSRTYRQLGWASRMSHPARLALGLLG